MKIPSQHIFDRIIADQSRNPLIENNLRGIFAEYLVADILGEGWEVCDGTYADYDLLGPMGAKLEVKSSAFIQSWWRMSVEEGASPISKPKFSIKERLGKCGNRRRAADVYVFALHESKDTGVADHRRVEQWGFYVCLTASLPTGQKTITLGPLTRLASYGKADTLPLLVQTALEDLKVGT